MTSLLRVRKRQQHAHVSSRIDASLLRTLFNTITIVPVHQECVILIREDTRSSTTCEKKKDLRGNVRLRILIVQPKIRHLLLGYPRCEKRSPRGQAVPAGAALGSALA